MVATKLGKYRISGWIGGGAFGDVFLAEDTLTGRLCALKVSRTRQKDIELLKHEARLLASLDHPHIVKLYSADLIEGRLVLAMEYVDGASLRKLIEEEAPLDPVRAVNLILQVLDALAYAHERGILHRDIKPENILLTREGQAKLTDFGLADVLREGSLALSAAGTPVYMAPEVWGGKAQKASDLWSTAAVLYELLSGAPPFHGENLETLRSRILSGKVKKIHRIPPALNAVLQRALAPDPESRYPSARAFAEALQGALAEGGASDLILRPGVPKGPTARIRPLQGLTEEQAAAVTLEAPHVLLLGGAGTGKTTTLVHRAAYLIEQGVPPGALLILTFTGKAAADIRERIGKLVSHRDLREMWCGTYHAFGLRVLARGADRLGYPTEELLVLSRTDSLFILQSLVGEGGRRKARSVLQEISRAKGNLLDERAYERQASGKWGRHVAQIFRRYEEIKRSRGLFDYDDLLLLTHRLLTEYEDLRELFIQRFQYLLVDEFQDINRVQYELIRLLAQNAHFFITGDDDQSIYGFRGASPAFLQRLREDYPDLQEVRLTLNFRSAPPILEAAERLISYNPDRTRKLILPARKDPPEEVIRFYAAADDQDEAEFVAGRILRHHEEGVPYEEMAVLYRIHARSRPFEEVFARRGIPYNLIGEGGFYGREEVRASIAFLKLLENVADREEVKELLTRFLGFGAREAGWATRGFTQTGRFTLSRKLPEEKRKALEAFWTFVEEKREAAQTLGPRALLEELYAYTGYLERLRRAGPARISEWEHVQELLAITGEFGPGQVRAFLNHVAFLQELEVSREAGGVRLLTVHQAKGLEFRIVFLVGMAEGIFPLLGSLANDRDLEEERRLAYVAMTRAQDLLYITYPKKRYGYYTEPSRFIAEAFLRPER